MSMFLLILLVPAAAQDARSLAEQAIRNTREQKSYATRFKARLAMPPPNDAIVYEGECLTVAPKTVYIHFTASGGLEKNVVRVGESVWVHHAFPPMWLTSREAGLSDAARGIQNPAEILEVLSRHLAGAESAGPGAVRLRFEGADIEAILKEHAQEGNVDWSKSRAEILLHLDSETRVRKIVCEASLQPKDKAVKGKFGYSAEVEVVAYNEGKGFVFKDGEGKEIPLSEPIRKALGAE